jgi:hypothetical protein
LAKAKLMELSPFAVEHEEGLSFFVEGSHRRRFRESLTSPKRRIKLIASLDHFQHLDYRWAHDASKLSVRELRQYLRQNGAPKTCYVLEASTRTHDNRCYVK